jgi:hypothetical protein
MAAALLQRHPNAKSIGKSNTCQHRTARHTITAYPLELHTENKTAIKHQTTTADRSECQNLTTPNFTQ